VLHGHQPDRSAYDHPVHYGTSTGRPSGSFATAVAAVGTLLAVLLAVGSSLINHSWSNVPSTAAQKAAFSRDLWIAGGIFVATMAASIWLARRSGANWLSAVGRTVFGFAIAVAILLWLGN